MNWQDAIAGNSSFSQTTPGLQLAWDSTSLGEFKICPRRYFYSIILGLQPRRLSIDLQFGLLLHSAVELFHRLRADGLPFDDALRKAIAYGCNQTWDSVAGRARIMDDPAKNRTSLIRAIITYLDRWRDDPIQTKVLASGAPAVELSFRFATDFQSAEGETFLLCGHLDRVGQLAGQDYVVDVKSTRHQLSERYFSNFSPDNQFTLYVLAGQVVFKFPVKGLICDALRVTASSVECQRQLIGRTPEIIDEWYEGLGHWFQSAEECARRGAWPQNDKVCGLYGGCPFRDICVRSPSARSAALEASYVRRKWDPLEVRGRGEL